MTNVEQARQAFSETLQQEVKPIKRNRKPILIVLFTALAIVSARSINAYKKARSTILVISGLGVLVYGAYLLNHIAGVFAGGLALLILELVTRDGGK